MKKETKVFWTHDDTYKKAKKHASKYGLKLSPVLHRIVELIAKGEIDVLDIMKD